MYTDIKSVQILIALLKQHNIRHLVLSAGNRHTPLVRSVEQDCFFCCHSVVDERSAAFFAIGLMQELGEPVAIACTSGTALHNYTSGVSEAYYRGLPLVVISADRNPYYFNQQEEQMVPQQDLMQSICKKTVSLPIVKDETDAWYCARLVNEALLALNHHGKGPVHINMPIEEGLFDFNTPTLPKVTKIDRVMPQDTKAWEKKAAALRGKKILITYGQGDPLDAERAALVEAFARRYNAVFMVDHLSNLHGFGTVHAYAATRTRYQTLVSDMLPDILICMSGNAVEIRGWLLNCRGQYTFWNVLESGDISDPFRCLDTVFECDPFTFLRRMVEAAPEKEAKHTYLEEWQRLVADVTVPPLAFSDIYAVQQLMQGLPHGALLHFANSNSVRLPQLFPLDGSVRVCCNRGTNGIDGSMSSFIGQASVHEGPAFLLVGDLSFFYDMNALWNRYVGSNVRIMLNNNACGEIFYMNKGQDKATVGRHIAADHQTNAKAWAKARGFRYLAAASREELETVLPLFLAETSDAPILLEVITDKEINCTEMDKLVQHNAPKSFKASVKGAIKSMLK